MGWISLLCQLTTMDGLDELSCLANHHQLLAPLLPTVIAISCINFLLELSIPFSHPPQPRIQRLVRKRFTHAPADDHERDEFVSRLYTTLIEQMNKVRGGRSAAGGCSITHGPLRARLLFDDSSSSSSICILPLQQLLLMNACSGLCVSPKVVNNKIKETRDANEDPLFEAPYGEVPKQSMQRIKELLMLATDAEANGRWDKALR